MQPLQEVRNDVIIFPIRLWGGLLICIFAKLWNVDTRCISEIFADNVIHLFI